MSVTRLNRAIAGAVVFLTLLVLAAVLVPLLSGPASVAAATDTSQVVAAANPPSDTVLAHQAATAGYIAEVQAQQAHAAAVAAAQLAAQKAAAPPPPAPAPVQQSGGVLSCGAVEQLWVNAGGPSGLAVLMAEIAGAESSRDPAAPYGGLWQIQGGQPVPGNINDPVVNAENAVAKYRSQGLGAWTTYTSGVYQSHPC